MEENKDLRKKSAISISAFICGMISIIGAAFYYISIPTGVLAIVFGTKGTRKVGSKLAKAGLIMGIVGLSICVFLYMLFISMIILYS